MGTKKKGPQKRDTEKHKGGRPSRPLPELIPDTPENVARACMQGPSKKEW